jgi:PAS domain S-box-containing protein
MLMLPDFRVRQRDFLLEISRAITAQLDLTEVLRRVLNASVVMLSAQMGFIALRNENAGFYIVRTTPNIKDDLISALNLSLKEVITDEDNQIDFDILNEKLGEMKTLLDPRLRQSVALPFIIAGEPLGLLVVFLLSPFAASPNDVQILQSFADQAAIAVHNAQLYTRIDHERKRLAAILQYSADGVMLLEPDLRISRFNRALERMTAWTAQEAIGCTHDEIIVWQQLEQHDLKDAMMNGWPYQNTHDDTLYVQGDLLRRDGLPLSIGILYAPFFGSDGRLVNIIANVRDITNFRRAQEMQSVFISSISHELKTPVAIIKGYAATLRRDDVTWDAPTVQEYSAVIEEESDRLTEPIQNLLIASKIQAERGISLDVGDVWLVELLERAVERFKTQTDKHQFVFNVPPDLPVIRGDEVKLRQVVDNLLSNAIKYSPNGGTTEVGAYTHTQPTGDNFVTLYVRDEGVGISETDQERIFERFYRVDSKLSRKTQGTGLGLFLAKTIVEAHKGMIRVESKVGQGSTFFVSLPVAV